jgi:hypothetical protein
MQRITFRIIVAVFTFVLGLGAAFIWRNLLSNLHQTPSNTISTHIEFSPVAEKYCEVHGVTMFKEHVPIRWGCSIYSNPYEFSERYRRCRRILFPNSNRYVWGGCVRNESISNEVYVCPRCRATETEWFPQASVKGK